MIRRVLDAVVALAIFALAAPGLAQPVLLPVTWVPDADESYGWRHAEGVSMGQDGRFMVTWETQVGSWGLFARRFDARAAQLGGLLPVGQYPSGGSSIARDASGRSVVVWAFNSAVMGRRFAADGTPLGDAFPVNAWNTQGVSDPSVAADPFGNFVVAWIAGGGNVLARRFDSSAVALGDEFLANEWTPAGYRSSSGIAMSPGGFVVTWVGQGASGPGIFARLFDSNGVPVTLDLAVDAASTPYGQTADVAMDVAGKFVVVWPGGPNADAVVGRRYSSSGAPEGGAFAIGAPASGSYHPRVASDWAGNFLVAWSGGAGDAVGRFFDASGLPAGAEFQVSNPAGSNYLIASFDPHPALADNGSFVVAWTSVFDSGYYDQVYYHEVMARKSGVHAAPRIELDPGAGAAPGVAGNGVFEPGETLTVPTAWVNDTDANVVLAGTATLLTGPAGANYTINDSVASYGTIAPGQSATCLNGGDCYSVTVSAPALRPLQHWDVRLQENLGGVPKTWTLHVGGSFADVPTGNPFYPSIETLFHTGVTGGCGGADYCPHDPVTRAQMAVFLLKMKFGAAHVPPPCTGGVFADVPCAGAPSDPWISELAALGITSGCGGNLYCPGDTVTRQQMAVFLLKTLQGSAYVPPACVEQFDDVPCSSPFAAWIGELYARGITGGCSVTPALYCPTGNSSRGQMAAFLVKTFGLVLYGG